MAGRKHKSKKLRRQWIITYMVIVFSIVIVFLVIAIPLASNFYNNETGEFSFNTQKNEKPNKINPDGEIEIETNEEDSTESESLKINVAIFGVDSNEALTDVIIVAMYNSETNKTNLVWVPRDTKISMSEERRQVLLSEGKHVPNVMKINAVHSYGGKKHGNEYSTLELEELLGIDIDNYAVVNLEAFRFIVDKLGGVEFNVPRNMYYRDPTQNLLIDLKAGYQMLDGEKAEQFVRFREDYANRDLGRIQAQQDFMKTLFGQALSRENVMSNLLDYIYAFFRYVQTDFNIADVPKYVQFLGDLNVEDMETYMIPGVGGSYFIHDEKGTEELIASLTNPPTEEENDTNMASVSSTNCVIKVLNGGTVNGLAQRKATMLKENGFSNVSTGNYYGTKKSETRIIVGEQGKGQDLKQMFSNCEIIVDKTQLDGEAEIVVVLGTNES